MFRDSPTILIVDPDERSYKTFESVLGSRNNVWFVPNGKTAIELPYSQSVDIIFVSNVLNGIDGISLLESFKKSFPSIPVVLIAEQPKVIEVITAFRSGARELITKPIDKKELVTITQKIIEFAPKKKPKRRWLFSDKKMKQRNHSKKIFKGYLKKAFQKSKQKASLSIAEFDNYLLEETPPNTNDFSTQLIANAPINPAQSDKVIYPVELIKDSCPNIQAFFLGSFRVFLNNQPIENWPSKKGKSIFAYFLLNHKKKIIKDILMDIFWRDYSPESARNNLNVVICGLRKTLKAVDQDFNHILLEEDLYLLNPEMAVWVDFEEFVKHHEAGCHYEKEGNLTGAIREFELSEGLYHGDFLEEDLYEDWPIIQRESLKDSYFSILDRLSRYYFKERRYATCIHLCQKILAKDNCREDSHRLLMRCFTRQCQRNLALRQFDLCAQKLKQELDVAPMKETIALYHKIRNEESV